ncbi:MAG TPA: hypothetical protein PLJ27_13840, partial [Polyangiaceae bacterium]|nr:hypothetical protein [Polyangiaceae bacterium]
SCCRSCTGNSWVFTPQFQKLTISVNTQLLPVQDLLRDQAQKLLDGLNRTEEDFVAHQKTQHYTTWKQTVTEWMSQPRQGVRHHSLFPDDTEW